LESLRAAAQKVDLLVSSRFLRSLRASACTVFPDRLAVRGASAGRDGVPPRYAVRFLASFRESVLDCPLVTDERAQSHAPQAHLEPQLLAAPKVAFPPELLAASQRPPSSAALQALTADGSV
jgi:hypothetical protein